MNERLIIDDYKALSDKTVFITGASGRLGKLLIPFLSKHTQVKIIIAGVHGDDEAFKDNINVKVIALDIMNFEELTANLIGVDIVFHLAALTNAGASKDSPMQYFDVNAFGTMKLMEACRIQKVSKLIYVSTSHVYGVSVVLPVSEQHPIQPLSIYASSKYAGEVIASSYARSYNMHISIARLANIYGSGFGKDTAIGLAVHQAVEKQRIELRNYDVSRDFIYITDVIEALVNMSCIENDLVNTEVLNVSSGIAVSLRQIVGLIVDLGHELGLGSIKIVENTEKIIDPIPEFTIDNTKLKMISGWTPRISIKEGLRLMIENELRRINHVK